MLKVKNKNFIFSGEMNFSDVKKAGGFSIVELMVGIAIGLFIISGASLLYLNNLSSARSQLLQARMDQNLRNTMDLIVTDLRRGAYWANSLAGTTTTSVSATANPYSPVDVVGGGGSNPEIDYKYAIGTDDSNLPSRSYGFRLDSATQAIEMNFGNSDWKYITDAELMAITEFSITPSVTAIDIRASCAKTCTGGSCPSVSVRSYNIVLIGTSKADATLSRTHRAQVLVRNHALSGSCPA